MNYKIFALLIILTIPCQATERAALAVYWEARSEPFDCQVYAAAVALTNPKARMDGLIEHGQDPITDLHAWRKAVAAVQEAKSLHIEGIIAFHDGRVNPGWNDRIAIGYCGKLLFYKSRMVLVGNR